MNSFSTLFYLKDERRDKNGKAGLCLRITVDGRRTSISLHRKIDPSKWDSRMNKLKGKVAEAEEMYRFMTTILHKVNRIQHQLIEEGKRTKTNAKFCIPLLPTTLSILEKYEDHPKVVNGECVLPVLSNQKSNAYLKEIADLCGIKKNLTTHLARNTFATTVTLSNGVPIETVGKMLGHKDLRTTQYYAKIINKKVEYDMAVLKQKLAGMGVREKQNQI